MTYEPILKKLAELVEAALPADSPWAGRVSPNVADPKDMAGNTWCVVEGASGARELVEGNLTMHATVRVIGVLVPTEGPWQADEVRAHLARLGEAVEAAVAELAQCEFDSCQILDARVASPVEVQAERAVGYSGEVEVSLVVQF